MTAQKNLDMEGISRNVYIIGDVMCDAVLYYLDRIKDQGSEDIFHRIISVEGNELKIPGRWYLATVHRAENTDDQVKIKKILSGLERLNEKVIMPVHPRIQETVKRLAEENQYRNIEFVKPVGYLEMLFLTKNAVKVITDSGGQQKEAYIILLV